MEMKTHIKTITEKKQREQIAIKIKQGERNETGTESVNKLKKTHCQSEYTPQIHNTHLPAKYSLDP